MTPKQPATMTSHSQFHVKEEVSERILQEALSIFNGYLEGNQLRKTPERFAILEEIYRSPDHFDAEGLYIHMKTNNYRVSRATVYNTLELLVQCELVRKHQFGKNQAQYERSHGYKQHDHLLCLDCGKVIEFCDPRIQQIKDMMGDILKFRVKHHALTLYGDCDGACDKSARDLAQ